MLHHGRRPHKRIVQHPHKQRAHLGRPALHGRLVGHLALLALAARRWRPPAVRVPGQVLYNRAGLHLAVVENVPDDSLGAAPAPLVHQLLVRAKAQAREDLVLVCLKVLLGRWRGAVLRLGRARVEHTVVLNEDHKRLLDEAHRQRTLLGRVRLDGKRRRTNVAWALGQSIRAAPPKRVHVEVACNLAHREPSTLQQLPRHPRYHRPKVLTHNVLAQNRALARVRRAHAARAAG